VNANPGLAESSARADATLLAILRGEGWPRETTPFQASQLIERAHFHGLQAVLADMLPSTSVGELADALRPYALRRAMWELQHRKIVGMAIAALAAAGIPSVLFKGTSLAYSLYRQPSHRERGDSDLIVLPEVAAAAQDVLTRAGFSKLAAVSGEFVSYQASFGIDDQWIDLHWKVNNSEVLSRAFGFPELLQRSQPLASVHAQARGAGNVDALLLACMHRASHVTNPYKVDGVPHFGGERLIWLYDMHLIANAFEETQWREFADLATEKGLCGVSLDGLRRTQNALATVILTATRLRLESAAPEPITRYFNQGPLGQAWLDFLAVPGMGARLQWLRESFAPPASYMLERYPGSSHRVLPWLYAKRALGGVASRLFGRATPH